MNINLNNYNFKQTSGMQSGNNIPTKRNANSKLGFGVNFNPMTNNEKAAEDLHTLVDIFKEASKSPEKTNKINMFLVNAIKYDFEGEKPSYPKTECFPAHEVGRIINKVRKNPEYGAKLLEAGIKILEKAPDEDSRKTAKVAKAVVDYIKDPEYKELTSLQENIRELKKIKTNQLKDLKTNSLIWGGGAGYILSHASKDDLKTAGVLCAIALIFVLPEILDTSSDSKSLHRDSGNIIEKDKQALDVIFNIDKRLLEKAGNKSKNIY